jgi:hypothetical protein
VGFVVDKLPLGQVFSEYFGFPILMGKPKYSEMDLREVGWDGRDWIDLAQDRDRWRAYVNAVMNLRVP